MSECPKREGWPTGVSSVGTSCRTGDSVKGPSGGSRKDIGQVESGTSLSLCVGLTFGFG